VYIVFNEWSTVTSEALEASDVLAVLRLRPILYKMGLMFLGVDAVGVND